MPITRKCFATGPKLKYWCITAGNYCLLLRKCCLFLQFSPCFSSSFLSYFFLVIFYLILFKRYVFLYLLCFSSAFNQSVSTVIALSTIYFFVFKGRGFLDKSTCSRLTTDNVRYSVLHCLNRQFYLLTFFAFEMSCMGLGLNASELHEARDYYRQALAPFTEVFSVIHSYAYVLLCVLGVFANMSIVVVLLRPEMRRSPFNLFLVCIAVCDASLMATYLLYKHVEFCHPWFFSHAWMVYTKFYAIFSVFVHSASLWFTVNMAVLRYLVLYRGSRSQSRLPPCNGYPAAIIAIIIGAMIALVGSLPNMMRYRIEYVTEMSVPGACLSSKYHNWWASSDQIKKYDLVQPTWWNCHWERINFWMAAWILKLIPCILLTVFMTLLVRMLMEARERRSRLCGGIPTGNPQAERTTAMLTGIVAVFLITELPQGVLGLAAGINPRLMFLTIPIGNFFDLLSLINSAVNFVLCALMSHAFRREFLHTFGMCLPQSSDNQSGIHVNKPTRSLITTLPPPPNKNGFMPVPTTCPEDGQHGHNS